MSGSGDQKGFFLRMSIRRQLVLLLCLITLLSIAFQLLSTLLDYQSRREENKRASFDIIRQTDTALTSLAQEMVRAGATIEEDPSIQDYLYMYNHRLIQDVQDRMELYEWMESFMRGIAESNSAFQDIAIVTLRRDIYRSSNFFQFSMLLHIERSLDMMVQKTPVFISWPATEVSFSSQYSTRQIGYIRPILNTGSSNSSFRTRNDKLGTCIVLGRAASLDHIVSSTAATPGSLVAVMDTSGLLLTSNHLRSASDITVDLEQLLKAYRLKGGDDQIREMEFRGRRSYVLIKTNQETGWQSVNIAPLNEIYDLTWKRLAQGLLLTAASAALAFVIGFLIVRGITRPVSYMTDRLREIGRQQGKLRLKAAGNSEFATISKSINGMLDDVESTTEQLLLVQAELHKTELLQKESEMQALQSQINPHFLYNTLECIRSIAICYKAEEIPMLTTSMASIFRYAIKGGIRSTVQEELKCVADYARIMDVRYMGRASITVDVEESLFKCGMVKMSLQPILENAFIHGLERSAKPIHVVLKGFHEQEHAVFIVSDDGKGIEEEKLRLLKSRLSGQHLEEGEQEPAAPKSSVSIGLINIHERIKLFYGEAYGLALDSRENEGTTVTIRIPVDHCD